MVNHGVDTSGQATQDVRLLGDYRIVRLLGEGGMAHVYEAEHVRLGRRVALKRLKSPYGQRADAVQSFFEEARAVNLIAHPNIVEVTDFVFDRQGAYCVMELLEGPTLADLLVKHGPLPAVRALDIIHQVADALAAAHRAGIVHRDIKPSNLLLTRQGERDDFVKVLDFGIAQLEESVRRSGETMLTGEALGTPAYMSPEQAEGCSVDGKADIYSLGVVLYEALAGKRPFEAATRMALVYQHTSVSPPPLRETGPGRSLPTICDELVMRCLRKDPDERHESAEALRDALQVAGQECGVVLQAGAPPIPVGETEAAPWFRLGKMAIPLLGVVLVTLAIAWLMPGLSTGSGRRPKATAVPPERHPTADAGKARRLSPVVLGIQSTPTGARVERMNPEPRTIGVTPLVLEVTEAMGPWQIRVSASGYQPRNVVVPLDRNRRLHFKLVRSPAPPGARRASGALAPTRTPRSRKARSTNKPRVARPRGTKAPRTDQGTINPFR